jgi:hypothetical protein
MPTIPTAAVKSAMMRKPVTNFVLIFMFFILYLLVALILRWLCLHIF